MNTNDPVLTLPHAEVSLWLSQLIVWSILLQFPPPYSVCNCQPLNNRELQRLAHIIRQFSFLTYKNPIWFNSLCLRAEHQKLRHILTHFGINSIHAEDDFKAFWYIGVCFFQTIAWTAMKFSTDVCSTG